jgi:hypothetical protein
MNQFSLLSLLQAIERPGVEARQFHVVGEP